MPNRIDLPDLTPEDLTLCIKQWLSDDERTPAWLAKKVGVADSTLRLWLDGRPDRLPAKVWLATLVALGRSFEDVRDTATALHATTVQEVSA